MVPWAELVGLIAPYAPEGKKGRPPFTLGSMLRVNFMQQWFACATWRWKRRCMACRCSAEVCQSQRGRPIDALRKFSILKFSLDSSFTLGNVARNASRRAGRAGILSTSHSATLSGDETMA